MQSKAIGTWKRFAIFGKKSMTQRLSPEECTSRYCACCPASKDSFLTQFDDWPRSPTATAAWQSQCLQKPLRHYHTKKQNHLPAPGLGQDGPKLEGNEPTMLFLGRPTHIAIPLKILPAARQVFTSNLLVDS